MCFLLLFVCFLFFFLFFFFFNDTATTEIYTLSLHDALPISRGGQRRCRLPPSLVPAPVRGAHHTDAACHEPPRAPSGAVDGLRGGLERRSHPGLRRGRGASWASSGRDTAAARCQPRPRLGRVARDARRAAA